MLFNGWDSLLRILIVGVLAYVTLIVFLRVPGKRPGTVGAAIGDWGAADAALLRRVPASCPAASAGN